MKRFGFALVARLAFAVAYPVVAWLCWVPNLVVAEWLLRMTSGSAPLRPPDGLDLEEGAGGDQNYGAAVVLAGAVLYSTSRPCPACEEAAARARVARMYFGSVLQDAGEPGRGAR